MTPPDGNRVTISLRDGRLLHQGEPCPFYIGPKGMRVGCHLITLEAANFIMQRMLEKEKLPESWDPCI